MATKRQCLSPQQVLRLLAIGAILGAVLGLFDAYRLDGLIRSETARFTVWRVGVKSIDGAIGVCLGAMVAGWLSRARDPGGSTMGVLNGTVYGMVISQLPGPDDPVWTGILSSLAWATFSGIFGGVTGAIAAFLVPLRKVPQPNIDQLE